MRTSAVVIGAGQAGLAVSHFLTARAIEHVVLERGDVANSWRTERWDSLRLLTPSWQTRLPGLAYDGDDPDGFMTMAQVVGFLQRYAEHVAAPVRPRTTVTSVGRVGGEYHVVSDRGTWSAPAVVLATGAFNLPSIPTVAQLLPASVDTVSARDYRNPGQLADGGVLVVGASATGTQIAAELRAAGRAVTLAVGEHVRMPRTYRERDIMWWMERSGILDERFDEVDDVVRARHLGSPQLVGTPERRTLDLNALTENGVRLVGRLMGFSDGRVQFSGSLRNVCTLADLKLRRLLGTLDEWAAQQGVEGELGAPERVAPTRVEAAPPLTLDLGAEGIRTVLWATGFRPDHSWLHVPEVLDRKGRLRHEGGVVTGAPGLYRMGLPMLRRRKSSYIHGAEDDARDLTDHLAGHVMGRSRTASVAAS
jgi:putative flavoprotein involved in K+ transport